MPLIRADDSCATKDESDTDLVMLATIVHDDERGAFMRLRFRDEFVDTRRFAVVRGWLEIANEDHNQVSMREEIGRLKAEVERLSEYEVMYKGLCK